MFTQWLKKTITDNNTNHIISYHIIFSANITSKFFESKEDVIHKTSTNSKESLKTN